MTEWLAELETDGAAVIDAVLPPDAVGRALDALANAGEEVARRTGGGFGRRNVLDMPAVARIAALPAIRDIVEAVLGQPARPVRGLFFDKTPAANWTVPWHQDRAIAVRERVETPGYGPWSVKAGAAHVQPPAGVLAAMLTVRLHLDDCGPDNGPLRIVPGTHRRLLGAAEVESASAGPQRTLACPAGGAVVMRPLALHCSSPAATPGHRRVLHVEYAAIDLPNGLAWRFG